MNARHLKHEDYKPVPWKNGLGTTLELASAQCPRSENSEAFMWRISIADMVQSNEFSLFPNTRRILTVMNGEGLVLKGAETGNSFTCLPFSPVSFSGSEVLYGELVNGPVQNFNVMVNGDSADAAVQIIENTLNLELSGDVNYFYVLPASVAAYFSSQSGTMLVRAGESYLIEASGSVSVGLQAEANLPFRVMHVCIAFK
ncbi:MAG: HutD family protein [Kordiimonas sp.]